MTSRPVRPIIAALAAIPSLFAVACATTDTGQRVAGATPNLTDPDEAGLWRAMDDHEAEMRRSPMINRDPALNAYVADVMCRVSADFCGDVRVYVVDRPEFNATMAPNGYSEVWAGLLLRAASEDQFAFVLGHEAAHFIENHSIERWRSLRLNSGLATGFSIVTAIAGAPALGDIARYATVAQMYAYSREHEREADRLGQQLAFEADYHPAAGADIWDSLIAEREASDDEDNRVARASVFASHPLSTERAATLRASAAQLVRSGESAPDRHLAAIAPHIDAWLDADIATRDFGRSLHLLDQLEERGLPPGVINLHRGDAYRLRGEDGDEAAALEAYRLAAGDPAAPARAHRELGMLLRTLGESPNDAAQALRRYLEQDPAATDRAFIERYIEDLEGLS